MSRMGTLLCVTLKLHFCIVSPLHTQIQQHILKRCKSIFAVMTIHPCRMQFKWSMMDVNRWTTIAILDAGNNIISIFGDLSSLPDPEYRLWVMGYSHEIPVNQLGRSENVWVSREYGLYLVWVRRESTVTSADSFTSYVQLHARIKIAFSSGTTCEGHR